MEGFEEDAVCWVRRLSTGDAAEKQTTDGLELLPMPLLRLLPYHHEGRLDVHVPLPDRGDGVVQFPIAPLLQRDLWPAACATDGDK